jgi:hypothetical protein
MLPKRTPGVKRADAATVGYYSPMAEGENRPPEEGEEDRRALAPMDFSTFVLSLGSSAMVNLGKVPPPDSTETHKDLAAAKQIIDILGVLEEKTRGNLDESEEKLLKSLLYDLRVSFVDAQKE